MCVSSPQHTFGSELMMAMWTKFTFYTFTSSEITVFRIARAIDGLTLGALGSLESTGGFHCQLLAWKRMISEN